MCARCCLYSIWCLCVLCTRAAIWLPCVFDHAKLILFLFLNEKKKSRRWIEMAQSNGTGIWHSTFETSCLWLRTLILFYLSFFSAQFGLIRLSCTHSFLFLFILCYIRFIFSEWRVVSIFLLSFLRRTCVSASLWFHFQIPFWSAVPNKVNKCIQSSDATRFASYFFFYISLDSPCPCLYLRYNCTCFFFRLFIWVF